MKSPLSGHESAFLIRSHLMRTGLAIVLLSAAFFAYAVAVEPGVTDESPDWLQFRGAGAISRWPANAV